MTPEDRMDIHDVQHLYGHVLDRGLWERLDEVFTEDGIFDPSDVGLPAMRGLAEIREKLIPLEDRNPRRCHHSTNTVIMESTPNTAAVLSKYICNHRTGIVSYGEYEDEMVKTPKGWRIKLRKTRRRGLGRDDGASSTITVDWDALLKTAGPRPPLGGGPKQAPPPIEDRLALLELQHLYGHVLDRGLWDRIGEVFTEDGVFDPTDVGLPAMVGLAEIREKLIPLEDRAGTRRCHHSTNAVILEASDGRARMLSKYICSAGPAAISYGEYEDELVRIANGWRIANRKTRRRAQGIDVGSSGKINVDWDGLLKSAPPRPALAPPPQPLPLTSSDRLELMELLGRYGHMFDRRWGDRLHDVFTQDGVFDPSSVGLPIVSGLDDFRDKFFYPRPEQPGARQSAHHTTNVVFLSATPTSAKLLSKYIVSHATAAVAFGEYEDDVTKTDDGWRIQRRKTFRRALGIDDGKSDKFNVDANGRIVRPSVPAS